MRSSARGLTTAALALAGALSVSIAGPHRAYAAPVESAASQADSNLAITVLSPTPHTSFTGNKPIEISAFYQGSDVNQIASLELYVDGSNAFTKRLDSPESRGVISFLIDTSQLGPGAHKVVVRAVAADAEVVSAKTSFIYVADQPAADSGQTQIDTSAAPTAQSQSSIPELSYMSPKADDQVQGTVKISLRATEPNGKSPYVSLFIDRTFKTLRNYAPYEFDWDTTSYTNGYHTIEAYGYDENQNVGPAQIVRVYVNNPGGRTEIRHDLKDGVPGPAKASLKTASKSSPYSPTGSRETKAMHVAVPTKPIDMPELASSYRAPASERALPLKPLQVARLDNISERVDGNTAGLSDPFVTTSGNSVGAKVQGMSRRPSPRMAMQSGLSTIDLRPVMLASRTNVLDETGGLHSTSDLSDPFIPESASPKPASRNSITPTTGFKPMPKSSGPVLAKLETPESATVSPALITRDAHTVPAQVSAPVIMQPTLDLAVKTVSLEVAVPVAKTVKAQTPIVHPRHVDIHTPAVPVVKKVAVHTPAAAAKMNVHRVAVHVGGVASLMRAKGEMKVLFNHTSLLLDRPITPRAGVMFSPLRQIFEFQGGSLTWQGKTDEVHATSQSKNILLRIGSNKALINNEIMPLQMAPYLDDGRTMVPLSFLPMALDVNVQFDQNSGHLLITTKN